MAYKISVSGNYGTHMAPLIQAVNKTDGDILEMGIGIFSTPYLHYQSFLSKRNLVSCDNDKMWIKRYAEHPFYAHMYQGKYHDLRYIKNWDDAKIEKPWDVVLLDHSPSERRMVDAQRLANFAKYIIIHDTGEDQDRVYHYLEIYPLFKYKTVWDKDANHATVLSNLVDLKDFWK